MCATLQNNPTALHVCCNDRTQNIIAVLYSPVLCNSLNYHFHLNYLKPFKTPTIKADLKQEKSLYLVVIFLANRYRSLTNFTRHASHWRWSGSLSWALCKKQWKLIRFITVIRSEVPMRTCSCKSCLILER